MSNTSSAIECSQWFCLISKTSGNFGYHNQCRILINKSLAYLARTTLLKHSNENSIDTYGRISHLKKDPTPSSQAISYTTLKEFEGFKDGMAND